MQTPSLTLNLRESGEPHFAQLVLSKQTPGQSAPMDVVISHSSARERVDAERFICDVYDKAYGATLDIRYPTLMSIGDEAGIAAAMGLRDAGAGSLFLEHYLDMPIEDAIRDATGERVERNEIVEVGNLASRGLGAAKYLYLAFHAYAFLQGYRYVAVTATAALGRSFEHMGITTHLLAPADPARLPGGGAGWGSYYDSKPQAMTGNIAQGLGVLMQRYGGRYQPITLALHTLMEGGHA